MIKISDYGAANADFIMIVNFDGKQPRTKALACTVATRIELRLNLIRLECVECETFAFANRLFVIALYNATECYIRHYRCIEFF